jgi:heme exporter protein B
VLRSARLVAGKDLRIELRSRVALGQVVPFAVVVLILFAFALDPGRSTLTAATPGLFWVTLLFVLVLTVQRSFALEASDGARDALRGADLEPAGAFLGKATALAVQLLAVEVVLALGVVILYGAHVRVAGAVLLVVTCLAATAGLASAGTLYGALAAGLRVRDTLLPFLLLPVVVPVLIGATRAFESALQLDFVGNVGLVKACEQVLRSGGLDPADGWPWAGLLAIFALVYTAAGLLAFGPLLEDA